LIGKELRELAVAPSFALMLVLTSFLVGHEFISAVATYSELSGGGAALARGMNPLDGLLVPTFGAYDLVAMLLLPFVVIRVFAHERTTGAWTMLVQSPSSVADMVAMKTVALVVAWLIAMIPGFIAVALWLSYGGHVYAPELLLLLYGHLIRALLTVAIAAVAAAVTRQAATAAIITLGVTIGTWALDFAAATRGGVWSTIALYTPDAALRTFEQGLARVDTLTVTAAIIAIGLVVASAWLAPGAALQRRWVITMRAVLVAVGIMLGAIRIFHGSVDVSEDRRHSFSEADEAVLRSLPSALKLEVHLGADDPRLTDYRREILDRLQRAVPNLVVSYQGSAGTGLLANRDEHYGEIWYELAGNRVMLKSAIEPIVLQTIYDLAGVKAVPAANAESYPGYPFKTGAPGAWLAFFVLWPAIVLTGYWRARKA
jgi:ABC-2 type transport system permease protein